MRKDIAVLGYGQRGMIYGEYARFRPEEFRVAAVIDTDAEKRRLASRRYGCPVFEDYREFLSAGIFADAVIVATQDEDHTEHAVACMEAGYDLLLEKPIANTEEECEIICAAASRLGRKVIVCHVLRYTPFYRAVKRLLKEGAAGEIVTVEASENVGYYHQAHSFVRGPWRNSRESSPMILAKCCHDMDILRWLVGKKCEKVSSMGALTYFNESHAPAGSAAYCSQCSVKGCVYRAQDLYLKYRWMSGYFHVGEQTDEAILSSLAHSPYDRCVYRCDNDVVDHQVTILGFEGGVTVAHSMTAFSKEIYRDVKIHGTKAELYGIMEKNFVEVRPYDGDIYRIDTAGEASAYGNHGGGDAGLMHELFLALNGEEADGISFIDVSAESHHMAFAAERSRLADGKPFNIK